MRIKRFMAIATAATMVIGSSLTAFAEPQTGSITGTGSDLGYLDTDVITCTVPTASLTNKFNFYADPNDLVKESGGKIATGSTTIENVTANDNKVYFVNAGSSATDASVTAFSIGGKSEADTGVTVTVPTTLTATSLTYDGSKWVDGDGTEVTVTVEGATAAQDDTITVSPYVAAGSSGYSATSDKVAFTGQNSVDIDLSAVITITASNGGKDIALVADEDALTAATTPAMLLTAYVGDSSSAITGIGADNKTTLSKTLAGKPSNFETVVENNAYKYQVKSSASGWSTADIYFVGKLNDKKLEAADGAGSTAPSISVAWSIAKATAPATQAAYGKFNTKNDTVWLAITNNSSNGGFADSSKISNVKLAQGSGTASACAYSYDSSSKWISVSWTQMKAAGVTWDASGTYNFSFTYDGTDYSAAVTPN